ncbi:hypothetical protein HYPBUDRAFT_7602 [Hyphopichia burtonii NRRL Y-1933]|uniref:Zn(2)-C6 fungal-type domain-containing protein n=1 Tax=Hyphopichia burtonii NRRL Y-1933 TaxID=984485 RepID=A0A1E4RDU2_9ASCO|nr:hypothetical protein HYPBUDRAFT_7602 [Hyphopichia burtonii NRRL Y-1933]ODV65411.1 hypothetical protein HYPBUDRAFT_7602 [Hyphopichia burtonii NRRL Y-1933]
MSHPEESSGLTSNLTAFPYLTPPDLASGQKKQQTSTNTSSNYPEGNDSLSHQSPRVNAETQEIEKEYPPRKKHRRRRAVLSCHTCRRKKIRCNRELPCDRCLSLGLEGQCKYDSSTNNENNFVPNSKTAFDGSETTVDEYQSQADPPESYANAFTGQDDGDLIGINPSCGPEECNMLYNAGTSTKAPVFKKKPNILIRLLHQDIGFEVFWRIKKRSSNLLNFRTIVSVTWSISKSELGLLQARVREAFGDCYVPHPDSKPKPNAKVIKNGLAKYGRPLGTLVSQEFDEFDTINESLKKIFPKHNVMSLHIKRFFEKLYPFYPIIDEKNFMSTVNKILRFDEYGNFKNLIVSNKIDLAQFIILLIMLRLSYLSVFTNNIPLNQSVLDSDSDDERAIIMKNPIVIDLMVISDQCLKEIWEYHHLTVLQALTMRHSYSIVAPEESKGAITDDLQVSVGLLVTTAYALKLDLDPDDTVEIYLNDKVNSIRRKLWYYIVNEDYMTNLTFNYVLMCKKKFTTKLPIVSKESSSISDLALEQNAINNLKNNYEIISSGNEIVKLLIRTQRHCQVNTVLGMLSELELLVAKRLGKVEDYINSERGNYTKIINFKTYFQVKSFIASIYQFFHLHFEQRGDIPLLFFFLKKVLSISSKEFDLIDDDFILNSHNYFDETFTMIVSPIVGQNMHALSLAYLGIAMRLKYTLHTINLNPHDDLISKTINELIQRNYSALTKKFSVSDVLSFRYFSSWRSKKGQIFGYSFLEKQPLPKIDLEFLVKVTFKYKLQNYQELIQILPEPTLSLDAYMNRVTILDLSTSSINECQSEAYWTQLCGVEYESEHLPKSLRKKPVSEVPLDVMNVQNLLDDPELLRNLNFFDLGEFSDFTGFANDYFG